MLQFVSADVLLVGLVVFVLAVIAAVAVAVHHNRG